MKSFTLVGDLVEGNGKTVRENNLARSHTIHFGSLVEIKSDDPSFSWSGVRLWVIDWSRDCDGTPLYILGPNDLESDVRHGGFSEENLDVIESPRG